MGRRLGLEVAMLDDHALRFFAEAFDESWLLSSHDTLAVIFCHQLLVQERKVLAGAEHSLMHGLVLDAMAEVVPGLPLLLLGKHRVNHLEGLSLAVVDLGQLPTRENMALALAMMHVGLAAGMVDRPVRLLPVLEVVLSSRYLEVPARITLVVNYHSAAGGAEAFDGLLLAIDVL